MAHRVLVVDDSITIRMDLQDALEEAGFSPIPCATLAAAREALDRESIDLIILDQVLPDGEGLDLLAEVRSTAARATIPIILLSTRADVADRVRGLSAGADEYAGKPYDRSFLIARVRELVREQALSDLPGRRILVIEDSPTFREELRQSLEGAGYVVFVAGSAEEGLHRAAETRPAAIVVDHLLPDLDGPTVVQRIRHDPALRGVPCLLLTASLLRDHELGALAAGADAYIRKEQGMDVLLARLAGLFREELPVSADRCLPSLFGPKRVLCVDDSETFLQALAVELRSDGYDVILARSGEEALALLAAQPVDCVLLDVVMPGVSGKQVCERIKGSEAWREMPVLLLTSREDRETMVEGINAGADDYIAKSSDFEVVRARIRAQLRRKHVEADNRRIREELYQKEVEAEREKAARELAESRAAFVSQLERKNFELQHTNEELRRKSEELEVMKELEREIAERRRVEGELRTASKKLERSNRELEQFLQVASHDLQEPLRTLASLCEMLQASQRSQLDEKARRWIAMIIEGAKRMKALMQAFVAYSESTGGEVDLQPVDCEAALEEAVAELRDAIEAAGGAVSWDRLPTIRGSSSEILLLFRNLISNAIRFRRDEPPRVHVWAEGRDEGWVLSVRDNGRGVPAEHADRIFRLFRRLHPDQTIGAGIGLTICRKIAENHGGAIWVEPGETAGSVFRVLLPGPQEGGAA